ncbi:hypothetical protein [Faecalibaculum rodentium]|uniref:Uncharacterized protein n=1 Tax=Faecalibaculum rodentium TaxID=1702221 RepID=A0A140DYT8_9FIRM|nr:hypothetical protein [Faecalibaculum rodentium]AMK55815.1 hypothetical protein AALO17_26810 [Faecalibaculum rodentium]
MEQDPVRKAEEEEAAKTGSLRGFPVFILETKTESSDIFVFARLELLLSGKGVKSIVNCPAPGDTYGASSKEGDTR